MKKKNKETRKETFFFYKKKYILLFYFSNKNYLKGKNDEKSTFCLASSFVVQKGHRLIQSVFLGCEQSSHNL